MKPIRDSRPFGDVLLSVARAVLGTEEGKGPLPWPSFEAYLKAAWEPLAKGDLAAAQRQGGVWRDVAAASVGGARPMAVTAAPAKLEGTRAATHCWPIPRCACTTAAARRVRGCRRRLIR